VKEDLTESWRAERGGGVTGALGVGGLYAKKKKTEIFVPWLSSRSFAIHIPTNASE